MPHQSTPSRLQFVQTCACGCGQPTLLSLWNDARIGKIKGQPGRCLAGHSPAGAQHHRFKGGVTRDPRGYILIRQPDHPHAKKLTGHVYEHRLVMEAHLGRYLASNELVHHRNEIKDDNRIENLELIDRANHLIRHNPVAIRWSKPRSAKKWSNKHAHCVDCGTTEKPHEAHGQCSACYRRQRYSSRPVPS